MPFFRRCIAPLFVLALLASADAARADTYYVSPGGADSAAGTAAEPFRTISKGAQVARAGDSVFVESGSYPETVTIPARAENVTFRGFGPTRPVVDGAGTRTRGFVANGAPGLTIADFEVTGQTEAGIYVNGYGTTIKDNLVHDVGSAGVVHSNGIEVFYGSGAHVTSNTVYSIGPGSESFGIWMVETRDASVDGNAVYLVRKEGIRDWKGLDNEITGNRVFLTWAAISLNTSTGSRVLNNYAYDSTIGIVVKHASYQTVLDFWALPAAHWSDIWQNTVWRTTGSSIALGQSDEPMDYVDVSNNLFQDAGLAYIHDFPSLRGPHVVVDGNGYAPPQAGRPRYAYKTGWGSNPGVDWNTYRSQVGWDANGRQLDPGLIDPGAGNLDYSDSSPAAAGGLDLGAPFGSRIGARGLAAAPATWTPFQMEAVDSSSPGTWSTTNHLQDTADDDQFSYWLTESGDDEFVTYDFGQQRTFDHLVLTVFSHFDKHNVRGYEFETSDDQVNWTTVLEGTNPDSAGSSYKYELPAPATGRYLRFTLRDTFCDSYAPRAGCGDYFVFSDLQAGTMDPSAVEPPKMLEPPKISVTVPRQRLSRVIRARTLKVRIRGDQRCRISSALSRRRGSRLVGRASADLSPSVRKTVKVHLKPAAVRKLAETRKIRLRLRTVATSPETGKSTANTPVTLRG